MTDTRPITIAIGALGGQGGGVLSGWVVATAEAAGYIAQYTSVPGVAQRTGATVYCIEIFPRAEAEKAGRDPVLALMPVPGDVDVVIASEQMEAGRAITRGFVTPDRTTLIASTHREFAISEKSAMGDGKANPSVVRDAAEKAAKRLVMFDMKASAEESGAVISAALFGALAGSGALPIARARYEETIRKSGRMVDANLAAFATAYERAQHANPAIVPQPAAAAPSPDLPTPKSAAGKAFIDRIATAFPDTLHETLLHGVRRCIDYQDPAYATLYLDRVAGILPLEHGHEGRGHALTQAVAKHLALWMSWEDTIRVADLKTRRDRFKRTEDEVRAAPDQVMEIREFLHPRLEEVADSMPAPLGRWLLRSGLAKGMLRPFINKGRQVRTTSLSGFLLLYSLAGLRRIRRRTLRYTQETARIETWLAIIQETASQDYPLAVEIARLQRLIKGYGDTHARGLRSYGRIMESLPAIAERPNAAAQLAALRDAALQEEDGAALDDALAALDEAREAAE